MSVVEFPYKSPEEFPWEDLQIDEVAYKNLSFRLNAQKEFVWIKELFQRKASTHTRNYKGTEIFPHSSYCYYGCINGRFDNRIRQTILTDGGYYENSVFEFLLRNLRCSVNLKPKISLSV